MGLPQEKAHYTVENYMQWPDEIRCELIGGEIWDMSPAPSINHQVLVSSLHVEIALLLREQEKLGGGRGMPPCQVMESPVDVVLGFDTVVQPDLIVVCDTAKLANGKNVQGAPDLVVEVLSPSTAAKDKRQKKALYERAKVPQYLIADPVSFYAELFTLNNDSYGTPQILGAEDKLALLLTPGQDKTLHELFGWPLPHQPASA
ncbi:MAG: Uma2 family endonuclease [Sulfuricellaceae bacterium]|nr:Uma2 family endonuclease [Sulfuricellaceae bacterium]